MSDKRATVHVTGVRINAAAPAVATIPVRFDPEPISACIAQLRAYNDAIAALDDELDAPEVCAIRWHWLVLAAVAIDASLHLYPETT